MRPRHARRLAPWLLLLAVAAAGCGSAAAGRSGDDSPGAARPEAPSSAAPGGDPLRDGFRAPEGSRPVAAPGVTRAGAVSAWYGVLEVTEHTDPAQVRDDLVRQALSAGYAPAPTGNDTQRLTGHTTSGVLRTVDVVAVPAGAGGPAYVRIIVTTHPGGSRR